MMDGQPTTFVGGTPTTTTARQGRGSGQSLKDSLENLVNSAKMKYR